MVATEYGKTLTQIFMYGIFSCICYHLVGFWSIFVINTCQYTSPMDVMGDIILERNSLQGKRSREALVKSDLFAKMQTYKWAICELLFKGSTRLRISLNIHAVWNFTMWEKSVLFVSKRETSNKSYLPKTNMSLKKVPFQNERLSLGP